MAEETKEVIFSLKFDTDEALRRAGYLKEAIEADKESLAALNKEIKANGAATKEQAKQREELEQAIRLNTKARQDETRALDSYVKATQNSLDKNGKYNGSINQLRASLSLMTQKWNDLTAEERENAEVGGKLRAETKRLSDQLKELEGSVGDNRRSVGGYLDAIKQAPGALGKFKAGIDGVGLAMNASPIGLFTNALQILPKLFGESSEGAGLFGKTMDQITAITNVFLDRFKFVGEAIQKFFSGDFSGAAEAARKSFKGIGDELSREVKITGELADARKLLERDEAKNIATSKRLLNDIERLKNVRDNEFNSIQVRNKANEDAFKIEMQRQATLEDLARRRLAIINKEIEIRGGEARATVEQLRAKGEAEEALFDILEDSAGKQNELITNRFQLNKEAQEQEKARREEQAKREKEYYDKQKEAADQFAKFQEDLEKIKADKAKELQEEKDKQFKESLDKQFKANEELRKKDDEAEEDRINREKYNAERRIAIKQAEYDAALALSDAFVSLSNLISSSSENASEFGKAAALFQLGISTAVSLANTIEAATTAGKNTAAISGPLAPVVGPATTLAYYASGAASIFNAIAQARQIIESEPAPKAPVTKFEQGGIVSGPSHAMGGVQIPGTGIEIEGGEAVISKRATSMFAPILSAINQLGGGKPLMPTYYAAAGGYVPASAASFALNQGSAGFDYDLLASKMAKANKTQPIYVIPTEIRDKANASDARKVRAGLGYK